MQYTKKEHTSTSLYTFIVHPISQIEYWWQKKVPCHVDWYYYLKGNSLSNLIKLKTLFKQNKETNQTKNEHNVNV